MLCSTHLVRLIRANPERVEDGEEGLGKEVAMNRKLLQIASVTPLTGAAGDDRKGYLFSL